MGIEPTFLAWQANILTIILCLLKLGYMANLPRYILAPYQAALILVTMCNWPRVHLYRRIGYSSNNALFTSWDSIRRDHLYSISTREG